MRDGLRALGNFLYSLRRTMKRSARMPIRWLGWRRGIGLLFLNGGNQRLDAFMVSCNYPEIFGMGAPQLGRYLRPEECKPGSEVQVAVLSDAIWRNDLAPTPDTGADDSLERIAAGGGGRDAAGNLTLFAERCDDALHAAAKAGAWAESAEVRGNAVAFDGGQACQWSDTAHCAGRADNDHAGAGSNLQGARMTKAVDRKTRCC